MILHFAFSILHSAFVQQKIPDFRRGFFNYSLLYHWIWVLLS